MIVRVLKNNEYHYVEADTNVKETALKSAFRKIYGRKENDYTEMYNCTFIINLITLNKDFISGILAI